MTEVTSRGILAFDIVHAVEFSRIGRTWCSPSPDRCQGNFSILTLSFRLSNRRAGVKLRAAIDDRGPREWNPHPRPEDQQTLGLVFRGGLFPLEGGGAFRPSALPCGATRKT